GIPIDDQASYVEAGWMKTEGGAKGLIGVLWPEGLVQPPYQYIVGGASPDNWTHYTGLLSPPQGADSAQVWLINFDSQGKVFLDDVLLFKVKEPTR
ncbi:MAG: hypothetical protein Q8P59_15020, partial [Dehalococcoidia bacterium]|nr:hypothetical protein [Dehalococcoidia bacterium]